MSATVIPTLTPGSPEWREQRMGGLGGSEIAAVLGLSPWESRFSLWHHKAGIHTRPDEDNEQMEWGRRLEPLVLAKWAEVHSAERYLMSGATYRNDQRAWQLAAPDGLAFQTNVDDPVPWVVEAKTSRDSVGWGDPLTDDIPVYYRAQVMHYMDTLGAPVAHVAVLIGGSDYREYIVDYDRDEAMFIREQAVQFLDDVAQGNRPPIDGADATYQVIRELHPEIDDADVDLDDALANEVGRARRALADAEDDVARVKSQVAEAMGNARRAFYAEQCVARRQARGDGTPYVTWAKTPTTKTITGAAA